MQYFHLRQETCLHTHNPALTVALLCSLVQKLPWAAKYHPVVLPLTALLFMNIDWNQKPSYLFHPLKIVCGHTHIHTHTHLTSFMIFILCEMKIRLFAFGVVKVRFTWALFPKLHTWVHSESRVRLVSWNKGGEGGGGEVYYFGVFSHELNM